MWSGLGKMLGSLSNAMMRNFSAVVQAAKVNDPSGQASDLDAEARTAINAIIDVLEGLGAAASV